MMIKYVQKEKKFFIKVNPLFLYDMIYILSHVCSSKTDVKGDRRVGKVFKKTENAVFVCALCMQHKSGKSILSFIQMPFA